MYEHHKISGKFDIKDSSVRFTEDSIISYHANKASIFESEYKMTLTTKNGKLELKGLAFEKTKGPFRTRLKTWFVKDADSLQKSVGNVPKGQREVSTTVTIHSNDLRLPDIQKIIELSKDESDSILMEVFDNGIIDNDSVSIFLNDSLIIKNQGISDKPISFMIKFPKGAQFEKIKMVAENLGSIPPNTAALKISTRKKYLLRLFIQ
jgi:hypothetical protein